MRVCPDCNGKGTYQGFNTAVESCGKCRGVGKLDVTKEDALKSVFDNQPSARKQFSDPADQAMYDATCDMLDVFDPDQNQLPKIVVGTPIYIYEAGWHESFVIQVFSNFYKTKSPCDTFRIPKGKLTYNITQARWEHIRHGTPVWP